MMVPYYNTVIAGLTQQIDTLTANFLQGGYNALANALRAPLAALITLFIVLTGYGITLGFIKTPMKVFYKFILRVGVIYFFAMNWGNFSAYMVAIFIKGSGELGVVVMNSTKLLTPLDFASSNITQGLQSVFTEVMEVGAWVMKKASFRSPAPLITGVLIWLAGFAVTMFALLEIVVSKLMLSLLLTTSPLFFVFILFDSTRSFFDRWLGFLAGFAFVLILVSAVIGLEMSLMHWTVAPYLINQADNADLTSWIPIAVVGALGFYAIWKVDLIAMSIGGSCYTGSGAQIMNNAISQGKERVSNMKDKHQSFKQWRHTAGSR